MGSAFPDPSGPPALPAVDAGGIPGSGLAGPFPVGEYAAALKRRLRAFARVQLLGELVNLRSARTRVYFELRDASGAVPCAVWRADWERLVGTHGPVADGMQVVVGGGCDYYAGSVASSPGFSFNVSDLRIAGEGDLLARIDRLRKALDGEGLLATQKRLGRPCLPRVIGVVTGESGKARDDVLAGLRRRGWAGRLVWGFAPVQDRHAAPAIARALQELAAVSGAQVIVVARGGGSLSDLLCFCDETLCRTVALLAVPVIASVGHHTDRTLIDDVAAVSCSTPTHAAEAAVPLHCLAARDAVAVHGERLAAHARRSVLVRAELLARQARAPSEHIGRERSRLGQSLRELRASGRRRESQEATRMQRRLLVLARKAAASSLERQRAGRDLGGRGNDLRRASSTAGRRRELAHLATALDAHDPQRTLERGFALVRDDSGEPVSSAAAARTAARVEIAFNDGSVPATIDGGHER